MIQLPSFTPEQKKKFEQGVILVSGKAMNRTALGIVDAFLTLYPNATFAELKAAMPDSINPSGPVQVRHLFKPYTEQDMGVVHDFEKMKSEFKKAGIEENFSGVFFTEPDEIFTTADGVKVGVIKMWESEDKETGENDLQRLINAVKEYGIVVNKFEARQPFKKGKYALEILQPDIAALIKNHTAPATNKSKLPYIIAGAVVLILLAVFLYFLLGQKKETKEISIQNEKQVTQPALVDTSKHYTLEEVQEKLDKGHNVESISVNFNNILFEYDSDKFLPESETDLSKALEFLNKYKNLKLKIIGHTSLEGEEKHNKELSEKRAKSVYDYLISKGIDKNRLSFEGRGMTEPLVNGTTEEENRKNRRTEFLIVSQ